MSRANNRKRTGISQQAGKGSKAGKAKKAGMSGKSGIKGNHQVKRSQPLLYVLLFAAVGIVMITLNQTRKRNQQNQESGLSQQDSNSRVAFTKEGELQFLAGEDTVAQIDIEIADDDYQTQQGLMHRRNMKQNRGMLFIFEDEQERSFWMKNTHIPLDILYVATDKTIVSIIENASPKSEESLESIYPAKYVVEVNAGYVTQHQIKIGDQIAFKRVFN